MYKSSCFSSIKLHWVFPIFFCLHLAEPSSTTEREMALKEASVQFELGVECCGILPSRMLSSHLIFFWNTLAFCRYLLVWNTGTWKKHKSMSLVNHRLQTVFHPPGLERSWGLATLGTSGWRDGAAGFAAVRLIGWLDQIGKYLCIFLIFFTRAFVAVFFFKVSIFRSHIGVYVFCLLFELGEIWANVKVEM